MEETYGKLLYHIVNDLKQLLDRWIDLLETEGIDSKHMVICDMQYLKKELESYEK